MDETTRNIIEKITINYSEPQEIRPKKFTKTYYDCSQLSINDLNRLAASAFGETKPEFEIAVPVNVYSILFAGALAHGHAVSILESTGKIYGPSIKNRKIILVSDVVHEGHEFIRAKKIVEELDAEIVGFVCIVDRSSGQVQPLFSAFQTDLS